MHGLAVESTLLLAKKNLNQNHNGTLGDPTQSSGLVLIFSSFPFPFAHSFATYSRNEQGFSIFKKFH
jgi:hypothetical protein